MAMQRNGVYVWVTWLSRLLVGDASCEWASWLRSHYTSYEKVSRSFDYAKWKINHTSMLTEVRERLQAEGNRVTSERQNSFRLRGSSGAIISGQPDLIAVDSDEQATVFDIKTGAERDSDVAQVMIYMYALPLIPSSPLSGHSPQGHLIYREGKEKAIPASAIDDFRQGLFDLIRRVVSDTPPIRVPSAGECGWCDLTSRDCPERIEADTVEDTPTAHPASTDANFGILNVCWYWKPA